MTIAAIWENDDLVLAVTVADEAGDAIDLTGATVEAIASMYSGTTVEPTVTVTDAAAGAVTVQFDDGALSSTVWRIQVRVTIADVTQTVLDETVSVKRSYFPA